MTAFVAPTSKTSRAFPGGFDPLTLPNKQQVYLSGRGYVAPSGTLGGWHDVVKRNHLGSFLGGGGGLTGTLSLTGGPNSTACITFNGTSDVGFPAAGTVAQPCHVFCVAKYTADYAGADEYMFDGVNGDTGYLRRTGATQMKYGAGGTAVTCNGCTPLAWHVHEVFLSGASSYYKEDGVQKGSGNGGTATMGRVVLGAFGTTNLNFARLSVAEFWRFSAEVTGTNLTNFRRYLLGKFAL